MDYKELLEHSFAVENDRDCGPKNRLQYLSDYIFDFTTYDDSISELFARKAVEVCAAITYRTTPDYINVREDYEWFLLMCNMPFFSGRIDWGSSIRGAWWETGPGKQTLWSSGVWIDHSQLVDDLLFDVDEWKQFICAVIEFAAPEMTSTSN